MTIDKNKYLAPTLRSVVLGAGALLCVSGDVKTMNAIGIGDGYTVFENNDPDFGNDF